jgi:hypothetical protein
MPFPLLPFVLGAAAGAAVTYFLTNKESGREAASDRALPKTSSGESEAPSATPAESSDAPDSPKNA